MLLSNHHVLSSRSIDELRCELGKRFFPHELSVTKKNKEVDSHVYGCAVNRIQLLSFVYGEDAPVECSINDDQCSRHVSLNFLTAGSGRMVQGRECVDISAEQGLVINADRPWKLNMAGYGGVALVFSHETLLQHACSLIGERAGLVDLQLSKTVDLTAPAGRALRNSVFYAMNEMNETLLELNNPISIANLENYLLTQFITLHPGAIKGILESAADPMVMPRNLKRARDYIHDHAHEKVTLDELVAYAGCSYRSLQSVFGKVLGMSPMAYLQRVRLEGARRDLLAADSRQRTVAEIASQWGFAHMGRFSLFYKKQFGVLPSDTLNHNK